MKCSRAQRLRSRRVETVVAILRSRKDPARAKNKRRGNVQLLPEVVRHRIPLMFCRRLRLKRNLVKCDWTNTCGPPIEKRNRSRRAGVRVEEKRRWCNGAAGTRARLRSEAQAHASQSMRRCARSSAWMHRCVRLYPVNSQALRYKLLKHKQGTLFVFAIDASGSMAANRIARAKSTILKLLRKSYLNRDSVAIVSFHGTTANVDLPPSRSILRARRVLDSLRMGGSTPLALGLVTTIELLELVGNKFGETVVLLFTDGRSNVPLRRGGLNLRAFRQVKIESELRELTVALNRTRARVIVVDTQKRIRVERRHAPPRGHSARTIREDLPGLICLICG